MSITEALGLALQEERIGRSLTLAEVAAAIPCHRSVIARMERGERLTHDRVRRYAAYLGLRYSELIAKAEARMAK